MELKQLEAFSLCVKLHNYSKVAKEMGVSLPTIINHIHALEKEFGCEIVRKVGTQLHPTTQGLLLLDYAKRMLALRDEAISELSKEDVRHSGTLNIASSTTPSESFIEECLDCFKVSYPNIRVKIHYTNSTQVLEDIRRNQVDLGFTGFMQEDSTLEFKAIEEDELFLVLPKDHPLASKKEVTIDELKKLPFLLREEGSATREHTIEELEARGCKLKDLRVLSELSDSESILQAIKKGLGVSILSRKVMGDNSLVALPLEGGAMNRSLYVVRRASRSGYTQGSLLLDCVEKVLASR